MLWRLRLVKPGKTKKTKHGPSRGWLSNMKITKRTQKENSEVPPAKWFAETGNVSARKTKPKKPTTKVASPGLAPVKRNLFQSAVAHEDTATGTVLADGRPNASLALRTESWPVNPGQPSSIQVNPKIFFHEAGRHNFSKPRPGGSCQKKNHRLLETIGVATRWMRHLTAAGPSPARSFLGLAAQADRPATWASCPKMSGSHERLVRNKCLHPKY